MNYLYPLATFLCLIDIIGTFYYFMFIFMLHPFFFSFWQLAFIHIPSCPLLNHGGWKLENRFTKLAFPSGCNLECMNKMHTYIVLERGKKAEIMFSSSSEGSWVGFRCPEYLQETSEPLLTTFLGTIGAMKLISFLACNKQKQCKNLLQLSKGA